MAADISDTGTYTDALPNLGYKMVVCKVACTVNSDYVEMSPYMDDVYYASGFDVTDGEAEAITVIDRTRCVMAAGGAHTVTIVAMGV